MWADHILQVISTPAFVTSAIAVLEFTMRLWPTSKAWSLLVPVKYACLSVASVLTFVGVVTDALIVNGQVTKPAETATIKIP